ncbi:glucose-1-phosphate adenylyltransferase family protein [Dissulfurirhabdus thermomarina]|uniref:glucose-1-phosphate adenylyltransferase family protein n=1 Tax=Dissulfurirhabdus thermomarina TaxID=1765737 RepID=UPI002852E340|nr:sugar phosphate nucleotidyltransferase [Dissulfurirhabdus thermomarina]
MRGVLAMVLAGGRVDELGVLTHRRPKSTVPFGGLYRVIDFPLSNIMHSGIERVGVLGQYRSASLISHIGDGASWDLAGRRRGIALLPPFQGLHAWDWYRGTANAVHQNLDFIAAHDPDLVLVLSGDHVYRMDYGELVAFHREAGADMTAAFVEVPPGEASRFGLGRIGGSDPRGGPLEAYREKPARPISNWASMTIYLFRREVLEAVLDENAKASSHEFGRDILPGMIGRYRVFGYRHAGYWGYLRTLEEYWRANMALLGPEPAPPLEDWEVRTNLQHERIAERGPAFLGPGAEVASAVLHNGVRVEGRVEGSVLFPGVHVEKGAIVRDSILFFDVRVGEGARLERVIADKAAVFGPGSVAGRTGGALTVVGARARIPKGCRVGAGCEVHPQAAEQDFPGPEVADAAVVASSGQARHGAG